MFKRSSKAKKQQSAQGSAPTRTVGESRLVDVTFSQQHRTQTGRSRGERKPARPVTTVMEEAPMPSTLVGESWARLGALKHAEMRKGSKRSPPRSTGVYWARRLLIAVPLLLALVFGVHTILTAPYFQVQHLQVEGTQSAQLIAAIQRLHLTGVNIFLADTSADAAAIETLPAVADASVTRALPATLLVHVVERQPVLIWQANASLYSVDAGGAIIAQVPQAEGLPLVSDEHRYDQRGHLFAPGGKINPKIIQMARQLLKRVPTTTGITSFTLRDTLAYGIVLISPDGWLARFGGPDNLENKIQELAAILQLVRQQGQQLALVDLRFGFYPYYRLKSSGAGAPAAGTEP